ncbi:alpha/beta fold hydrolase [Tomitella biformata]|uniref:alpha/beta fold hydrolase n=1 Tax=Tomitella biformata TaxID=630403 RepID=UPI0004649379|nr:alpha/beta hydrolase [Tomitella biformata]
MAEHSAAVFEAFSADGTRIVFRVDGNSEARPLVLIHGWAQSSACWGPNVMAALTRQYRVIAIDLRGHGYSGAPDTGYDDSALWAADVAAVLAAAGVGPGDGAILLGWSYGGLVCCDYLAAHPESMADGAVAGLVLVGAITGIGRGHKGGRVGPAMRSAMPAALSEDPEVAVPALVSFASALRGAAVDKGADEQRLLGLSISTPPRVRAAIFQRSVGHDDLLAALPVPALIMHGEQDAVVDPSAARHTSGLVPRSRLSLWEGGGHAPFMENEGRFISEIDEFIDAIEATQTALEAGVAR